MQNPLIKKYGKDKRWVSWKLEQSKGRATKIPYSLSGKMASSTDEKSWSTAAEVKAKTPDNLGIVFTPDQNLLGIDLDKCLEGEKITHAQKENIAQLIIEADTYTEVSPSGTGLHIYLALSEPLSLEHNRHGNFEAYTDGRYFTVTGIPYRESRGVRTVTPEEALALLAIIGYPWNKDTTEPISSTGENGHTSKNKDILHVSRATPGEIYTDEQINKKLFKSKGGAKAQRLYEGDLADYKGDGSAGDMALLSHYAFWTGKNAVQMERLWLASPLGTREKTQKRADYRSRSIKAAISVCKEVYESKSRKQEREMKADAPELDLLFTMTREREKIFTRCTENVARILRNHPYFAGTVRFDTFKNIFEIRSAKDADALAPWRQLEDNDTVVIQTSIQQRFECFQNIGKEMVEDAVTLVGFEKKIDSAADWLKGLVWDKKPRLDMWLTHTFHVEDSKYYRAVASNWMKGIARRIMEPGCKFDYVLVLEGEQGTKKSTSLAVLGGAWHVETTMGVDSKDFFMQLQGKVIVEFSEGETLSRTETKKMKAIITQQMDRFRPPYGRLSIDTPRRCVFAMTTNQSEYLKDETGNRRWLPVACVGNADIEWLSENREQLYAEAYHRGVKGRETLYEFPEEETFEMQSARRISSPNLDLIADWYVNKIKPSDREYGITIQQVYRDALHKGFDSKPLGRFDEMEIADVLKNGLRLKRERKMQGGIQSMRWMMSEQTVGEYISPTPETLFEQITKEDKPF